MTPFNAWPHSSFDREFSYVVGPSMTTSTTSRQAFFRRGCSGLTLITFCIIG
jgi:hypothetical protein